MKRLLLNSSSFPSFSSKWGAAPGGGGHRRCLLPSLSPPFAVGALPARRGIFERLWRPKPVPSGPPPPLSASSTDPKGHTGHRHGVPHHINREQLWGARTGVGSENPPPLRAAEDLVEKLERAHHCTQQLRQAASSSSASTPLSQAGAGGGGGGPGRDPFIFVPAYVPVGLDAPLPHPGHHHHQHHHRHHGHHHHHARPRFGEEDDDGEGLGLGSGLVGPGHGHGARQRQQQLQQQQQQQQHLEDLIAEHFRFRLRRLPSTVPGAGLGLFLASGRAERGDVLTCYPGLIYRIPYDLESCMPVDEVSFTPCPPEFLLKNDYLLRFTAPCGQHFLLDGCPRGVSALNFIKANQRRARLGANIDWLESTAKACGLRPSLHHDHEQAPSPPPPQGEHQHQHQHGHGHGHRHGHGLGEEYRTAALGKQQQHQQHGAGGGGGVVLLPAGAEAADPRKYFTAALGMGHMTQGAATGRLGRCLGRRAAREDEGEEDKEGGVEEDDDEDEDDDDEHEWGAHFSTFNDPGDPAAHNAEFHLCELPRDVPPHLLRYLPNLNYSDALGDRRFAVLVTAARDLEVPEGGAPIEIFVPYSQQAECRPGFPLM